jgi:hypothetical protein
MDALTILAGACNGLDYYRVGLTFERMGLSGIGPDEILAYARNGPSPSL